MFDKIIDRSFEIFDSKDRTKLFLILIVILGLTLRIIAAVNLGVFADDMHHTVHAINFIESGKLTTWDQSAGLWHALTDIYYKTFGIGQLTSRFNSIIFGTLTLIVLFLFTKQFFNKKIALISAFLLAISPFYIKNTVAEMDVTVMFFVLTGMLFFLYAINKNKLSFFALSGAFMGLGVYTKVYALLFIPSLMIYLVYREHKESKKWYSKELLKKILVFGAVAFIFCIPAITTNYLLYKDKGFVDFLFTETLGIGKDKSAQYYSWVAGGGIAHDWRGFFLGNSKAISLTKMPSSLYALEFLLYGDPVISILVLLGIFLLWRKNKNLLFLLFICFIVPFTYLASIMLLSKHYIFMVIFSAPIAAFAIDFIHSKTKIRLRYILIILLILSLLYLGKNIDVSGSFYSKSAVEQIMSYKSGNIPANALILADSRIYRDQLSWIFNDRIYLEAAYFDQVVNSVKDSSEVEVPTDVYFVECGIDDCGWGTVKDQPDLNASMEEFVKLFETNSKSVVMTQESSKYSFPFSKGVKQDYYKVYRVRINLKPEIFDIAKKSKISFMYPVGYDRTISPIFDDFNMYSTKDTLLYKLARMIEYLSIILALILIPLTIILFILYHE